MTHTCVDSQASYMHWAGHLHFVTFTCSSKLLSVFMLHQGQTAVSLPASTPYFLAPFQDLSQSFCKLKEPY